MTVIIMRPDKQRNQHPIFVPGRGASQGSMPVRRDLSIAIRASVCASIAVFLASAIGVVHPDVFHETAMTAGNARGTALVLLVVAVPTLVLSMLFTAQGSSRAPSVWLGALGYITY